ncbi:helix-turn-helix domain-containing protein [Sinorhizobium fredii]|uniref:helix-turn-helix domain-containing protein n=1 Tax=Rhizobium fredii TaxID=380 RepID=UPI0035179756
MSRELPIAEQVAGMIGEIRRHGLGPAAIARESGLSRQSIWRLEAGESRAPSADTVERLERLRDRVSATKDRSH